MNPARKPILVIAGDAGYLQRPLLLRAQPPDLGFDHLPQGFGNLDFDLVKGGGDSPRPGVA